MLFLQLEAAASCLVEAEVPIKQAAISCLDLARQGVPEGSHMRSLLQAIGCRCLQESMYTCSVGCLRHDAHILKRHS